MDREVLCESLILWLETFNLDVPYQTPEVLSDGYAMAKVLNQIAPDYFNDGWMSKIKTDQDITWRIKVSNLKKILKGILEYNVEVLGIQIHDFQMPDVNAIGEHSDHGELGRLLQLILGCAVNCTEKQEYIQRIMAMEESVQHAVMTAIQELMTKEISTDGDSELGEQLKRTVDELNSAIEAKEELMQRCHDLDLQVASLNEEKQNLYLENEKLSERLNQSENLDDPTVYFNTPAGKRFQQLQHQLDQYQEENYKLESAKDDFRIKVDVLQKEVNELKDKNTELTSLAEECRLLKDELDVVRHAAEQVSKYETQIESYKKKMEELSDLRGQVKLLEDKNTKYMQDNLEIQEEVRKSSATKQQLEVYKRQVMELQSKLTEETKRADKAEFESKRIQEKHTMLQREKERIVTERDSLREVNEELKCTQLQHVTGSTGDELSASTGVEMLSLPPEIKEKMLRLEHENKMLKLKSSGDNDENASVLQAMLDDANTRKNELETDLRLANQKIMELEAQLEDLQEMAKTTVSNTEMVELRKKLDEQVALTQQKDKMVEQERENVTELQGQLTAKGDEFEKMREALDKKEEEKRVMGEKYKKYFDKARAVISSQEQKLKSSGNYYPGVQALKQQLQEKDKYIEQLQKEQGKHKSTFEQEEKLMVSAWYNLGIQLHRQAAIDRLESSQGQGFLNRQRQVHLRSQQRIPNHSNQPSHDQNVPANENAADGCFASLLDCMLTRFHDDLHSHCDLDPEDVCEDHSGQKLTFNSRKVLSMSKSSEEDTLDCHAADDSDHEEGNTCNDKETNINSYLCKKPSKAKKGKFEKPLSMRIEVNTPVRKTDSRAFKLIYPNLVPETPIYRRVTFDKQSLNSSTVPLLGACSNEAVNPLSYGANENENPSKFAYSSQVFFSEQDHSAEEIQSVKSNTTDDLNNSFCNETGDSTESKIDDNCYVSSPSVGDSPNSGPEGLSEKSVVTPFDSFFQQLDRYNTSGEAEISGDKIVLEAQLGNDSDHELFASSPLTGIEILQLDHTHRSLMSTPKQDSPFLRNISTEKVTKRRRKRKYTDENKENNISACELDGLHVPVSQSERNIELDSETNV